MATRLLSDYGIDGSGLSFKPLTSRAELTHKPPQSVFVELFSLYRAMSGCFYYERAVVKLWQISLYGFST